jgi:plastocyanin
MTRRTRTLLLALLALAGCGSQPAIVRQRASNLTVTLDEYYMRPQRITIPAGTVTVHVINHGRLGHTFRLRSPKHDVMKLTTIKPGATAHRTFRLAPGTYTMYCALANHEELGMSGTLVVR